MGDLVALSGLVESVEPERLGSTLTAAASAGDTVLQVASSEPFETEAGTGRVLIAGAAYDQIGIDADSSTVTIDPGLADDMDQDVEVNVSPLSSNVVAKVSTAAGDVITARVATAHIPYLRIGDRDPDEREAVTLYREGQGYVTLDVPNGTANSDADGLPMIPAEAVQGGPGGGLDGGNDDDGFVLSTLSEFVPDGDPDYWVVPGGGKVMTEDQVYDEIADPYFVDNFEMDAGTLIVTSVFPDGATADSVWVYPAWKIPLVGQDSKLTIGSATADGLTPETIDNPWNDSMQVVMYFGAMYDEPLNAGPSYSREGLTWGSIDSFRLQADDFGSGTEYFSRTWASVGGFDEPMPSSSGVETFAQPNKFGLIVAVPVFIVTGGETPVYTTSATFTGVRMEQA